MQTGNTLRATVQQITARSRQNDADFLKKRDREAMEDARHAEARDSRDMAAAEDALDAEEAEELILQALGEGRIC
eukprot:gene28692-biopygen32610